MSSGEGLIHKVRDPHEKQEPQKHGGKIIGYQTVIDDHGEPDKRLFVLEQELSSVLKVMARERNTLSAIVRSAWETGDLQTLTKNSPTKATGAHVSIVGHITADELRAELNAVDIANGFANRFLWLLVKRSKELPDGEAVPEAQIVPIISRLRHAADFARNVGVVTRDADAAALWRSVYHDLSAPGDGLAGAVTGRAEAQVLRLSLLYALLDCSPAIRVPHLAAALALWEYARASVGIIFGARRGDPKADTILTALREQGPLSRTEIFGLFSRNLSSGAIDAALDALTAKDLIEKYAATTAGRPAEMWRAVGR